MQNSSDAFFLTVGQFNSVSHARRVVKPLALAQANALAALMNTFSHTEIISATLIHSFRLPPKMLLHHASIIQTQMAALKLLPPVHILIRIFLEDVADKPCKWDLQTLHLPLLLVSQSSLNGRRYSDSRISVLGSVFQF